MRRMRLHLVSVCELNRESWRHIHAENDDDFEWLSHPRQTDQLGIPLTAERIEVWLTMMDQFEQLLKGESLVSSALLSVIDLEHEQKFGLNVKNLLDDPPVDLLNFERINEHGIDAKYLEPQKGRKLLNVQAIVNVWQLFDGPLGFAYAARLN